MTRVQSVGGVIIGTWMSEERGKPWTGSVKLAGTNDWLLYKVHNNVIKGVVIRFAQTTGGINYKIVETRFKEGSQNYIDLANAGYSTNAPIATGETEGIWDGYGAKDIWVQTDEVEFSVLVNGVQVAAAPDIANDDAQAQRSGITHETGGTPTEWTMRTEIYNGQGNAEHVPNDPTIIFDFMRIDGNNKVDFPSSVANVKATFITLNSPVPLKGVQYSKYRIPFTQNEGVPIDHKLASNLYVRRPFDFFNGGNDPTAKKSIVTGPFVFDITDQDYRFPTLNNGNITWEKVHG